MDKVIVLDEKMRRAADLDPDKVIDPVTIEDAQAGECSLRMGYPATGPLAPGWAEMTWEDLLRDYGDITWNELTAELEGIIMAIYLPELVDKIVTTIAGLKANWEDYIDHAGNTADAHGIDVIAEDLADHAAETAEDDVHGLAGKVIAGSGSNDDGSWVRFSNGLQVCWGSKNFPGEGWSGSGDKRYLTGQSLTFPATFDSEPTFLGTTRDAQIAARSAKLANFNVGTSAVSNMSFNGWGTASSSFYLHWVAIGWWK